MEMFKMIIQGVNILYLAIVGPYILRDSPKVGPWNLAAWYLDLKDIDREERLLVAEKRVRGQPLGNRFHFLQEKRFCYAWSHSCCTSWRIANEHQEKTWIASVLDTLQDKVLGPPRSRELKRIPRFSCLRSGAKIAKFLFVLFQLLRGASLVT